jgi:hypothetical protein
MSFESFTLLYPLLHLFFGSETISKNNYKIGNTVFINDPPDIRTISRNENVTRLINSSKCPFTNNSASVYLFDVANETYRGLRGIHASIVSDDRMNWKANSTLGECFKNKMTDYEIQKIKDCIDNNHDLNDLLLRIFLKRIYPKRKHIINKLIEVRHNDDELKLLIRKSNPPVPEYEVYTTIILTEKSLSSDYITKLYREKLNYLDYPTAPTCFRFAAADMTIGDISINKGDTLVLNVLHAAKTTRDKRFCFGCGTDFRKCQLADFLDDFLTRIAK